METPLATTPRAEFNARPAALALPSLRTWVFTARNYA